MTDTEVLESSRPPRRRWLPFVVSRTASVILAVLAISTTASIAYGIGVSSRPAPRPAYIIVKCPVVGDHVVTLKGGLTDVTVGCPR